MHSELVMITGIGGPAGKSAVSYLHERGFPTIGTDMREIAEPVDIFYKIPPVEHPSYVETLMRIIREKRPSLLIPTVTEELPIISRFKETIEGYGCMVFISAAAATEIAHDKLKTAIYMNEHGIPAPQTLDEHTPHEDVLKELDIPFLSKPRIGRGGRGIVLHRSQEEVYRETRTGIVFQEFIPGDDFDLNMFVDENREVLASVVLKKTVLKEGIVGNALEVERVERNDIDRLGRRIVNLLRFEGPLDIDIRLRADGTPVLLEINARLGGNVLAAPEILDSLIMTWKKEKKAS